VLGKPAGLGLATWRQRRPFQCRIMARVTGPLVKSPTAHALAGETAATALRELDPGALPGGDDSRCGWPWTALASATAGIAAQTASPALVVAAKAMAAGCLSRCPAFLLACQHILVVTRAHRDADPSVRTPGRTG